MFKAIPKRVSMRLKKTRLQHPFETGHIEAPSGQDQKLQDSVERDCLICYEGEFQSMDGPVSVTSEMLERIAQNHNAKLASAKKLESGEIHPRTLPPVQLDHSEHATNTVGRLIGQLTVKPYTTDNGDQVMGLFGRVKIMGKENVEKINDGRWSALSIGADFEMGTISELTITPFPAAPEASLLSKGKKRINELSKKSRLSEYKGHEIGVVQRGQGLLYPEIDGVVIDYGVDYASEGEKFLKSIIDKGDVEIQKWKKRKLSKGENKMSNKKRDSQRLKKLESKTKRSARKAIK
jgi:hypothetical protein